MKKTLFRSGIYLFVVLSFITSGFTTGRPTMSMAASQATPTLAPPSDTSTSSTMDSVSWSLEEDISLKDQAAGIEVFKNQVQSQINTHLTDQRVMAQIQPGGSVNAPNIITVHLTGQDGAGQFQKVVFGDLQKQIKLIAAPVSLDISGQVENGKTFTLRLEANPSTGSNWKVTGIDARLLKVSDDRLFTRQKNGVGGTSVQTIEFSGIGDGQTAIGLKYIRPWVNQVDFSRRIQVNAGSHLTEGLNLSAPDSSIVQLAAPKFNISNNPDLKVTPLADLPGAFDWRTQNGLTAIRNQGGCGSCWAFAVVGAMEAAIKIKSGTDTDLSEQYLINCNDYGYNCEDGGWHEANDFHTDRYIAPQTKAGAVLESDLPYTEEDGSCSQAYNHPYKLESWHWVSGYYGTPSVDLIKNTIYNYGPVAVSICAGNAFDYYSGGVFSTDESSSCYTTNHAVVLTGWDDSTQSWVLRNSWGTWWGEDGYMRIRYGTSRVGWAANYVVYTPSSTPAPGAATLISPKTTVTTSKPTFVWSKVTNSSYYRLWVKNSTGTWITQDLYNATNICGVTNCAVTPSASLANGSYTWYIQTLTPTQNGVWTGQSFVVNVPQLKAVTLVSPKGTIHTVRPTYIWAKDSNSTYYRLWLKNSVGTWIIQKLILGTNICGTTNCAITIPTSLSNGAYTWYVQTLTATQNGQWSGQPFTESLSGDLTSLFNSGSGDGVK